MISVKEELEMIPIGNQGRTTRQVLVTCPFCNNDFKTLKCNLKKIEGCSKCGNKRNRTKTHGETNTRLFKIWNGMINRCHGKGTNTNTYKYHRDKGVTVCTEWRENFIVFKEWSLQNDYKENLEIDKDILCDKLNIHPKIYSPKTCLWVTKKENSKQITNSPTILIKSRCKECKKNMFRKKSFKFCSDICIKKWRNKKAIEWRIKNPNLYRERLDKKNKKRNTKWLI